MDLAAVGEPYFRLEAVAEGIWGAIVVPGRGAWGNAAIVDLGDRTLVFDTFLTPPAAQALRAAAEALTGRPVAFAANSHRHMDHVFGNQVFGDVPIIATRATRDLIASEGRAVLEWARAHPDYSDTLAAQQEAESDPRFRKELADFLGEMRALAAALPAIAITPPTLAFDERLVLHGSRRSAELLCFGGGHSQNDAFVYLPDDGVALMGDLVQVGFHPSMDSGDPVAWLGILEHVAALPIKALVPGHGPVGDAGHVGRLRAYLADLLEIAGRDLPVDLNLPQARELIPAAYADWESPSTFAESLLGLLGKRHDPAGA